jgi:molybdopterin synthase sulfur carrier subunit
MQVTAPQVRVILPHALRSICSGPEWERPGEICLRARDVRDALEELARQYPQVHVRVCDERGEPRRHIHVFVNDDHVRARAGLDTPLAAGDTISILPAVSGG